MSDDEAKNSNPAQGGAETVLTVLGERIRVSCPPEEARRLADLAAALETRLGGGAPMGARLLVLLALGLLDEAQGAAAALQRARCEIDRLNELIAERQAGAAAPPAASNDSGDGVVSFARR